MATQRPERGTQTGKFGARAQALLDRVIARALQVAIVRAFLHYKERSGPVLADSLTYRALFSVFAGVLLLLSAAAVWLSGDQAALQAVVKTIEDFIPGIGDAADLDAARLFSGFTLVGAASIIGLISAAIAAVGTLRTAIRALADVPVNSGTFIWMLVRNLLVAIAFGGLLFAAAAASLLTSSGMSVLASWLGIAESNTALEWVGRSIGVLVALAVNTAAIAVAFLLLSGRRVHARSLWLGALAGGIGLLILQEFSGAFVRGATSNPLLASFAAIIALLLWINLSAQVILLATSLIVTLDAQARDRVGERFGASTLAQFHRRQAEQLVATATRELRAAQADERAEHAKRAKLSTELASRAAEGTKHDSAR